MGGHLSGHGRDLLPAAEALPGGVRGGVPGEGVPERARAEHAAGGVASAALPAPRHQHERPHHGNATPARLAPGGEGGGMRKEGAAGDWWETEEVGVNPLHVTAAGRDWARRCGAAR